MLLRLRTIKFFLLLLLALAGCGSPPAKNSVMLDKAVAYNQQGRQFFHDSDYSNALTAYRRALQADRGIENADGVALNLLNLAQTYLALNQVDAAQVCLDEILSNAAGLFSVEQLASATIQKALISIREPQPTEEWINKADALCADKCSQKGLILNVRARLALDKNLPNAAVDLAKRALSLHRKMKFSPEIANSLRLVGEAYLGQQLPEQAIPFFQEALQLDKELGLPVKISMDLLLLGKAHQGSPEQSAVFFKRAFAVSQAAGDKEGMLRAGSALAKASCQGQVMPCD